MEAWSEHVPQCLTRSKEEQDCYKTEEGVKNNNHQKNPNTQVPFS